MSQKKARRKKKANSAFRNRHGRRRVVFICALSCLLLTGVIIGRWRALPLEPSSSVLVPEPQASPSSTPNPFVPKRAAKEYIYVGGKLQALEEPKPPAGGASFDFTGNGSGDAVVFRPSEAIWYVLDLATNTATIDQLGASTDSIVPGDYDGDSKTDLAVWRPNTGTCSSNQCGWYIKQSSTQTITYYADWGQTNDVAVPADYDGDGKTDRAVYRPTEGNWYIQKSTGGSILQQWGAAGDKPVAADYDGDGRADIAVFRPSEGNWYIRQSSNGVTRLVAWGQAGDRIVPADYDGDRRVDIAVWRPSDGNWYVRKSSNGTTLVRGWGASGDVSVPAAYVRQ